MKLYLIKYGLYKNLKNKYTYTNYYDKKLNFMI